MGIPLPLPLQLLALHIQAHYFRLNGALLRSRWRAPRMRWTTTLHARLFMLFTFLVAMKVRTSPLLSSLIFLFLYVVFSNLPAKTKGKWKIRGGVMIFSPVKSFSFSVKLIIWWVYTLGATPESILELMDVKLLMCADLSDGFHSQ
ncbi:unnamed protein product [Prunus brigantina]